MGRYYYGDIEGKFWFAVQPSTAADRFGVQGYEPQYLEYWFQQEDLEKVQAELKRIEEKHSEQFKKIKQFFEGRQGYTDEELADYLKLPLEDTKEVLRDYADYELGKKIEQSIIAIGECSFTAEL